MEQNNSNNMNNQNVQNFGANQQTGANYTTGANGQNNANYSTGANQQTGTNYADANAGLATDIPYEEKVSEPKIKKSKKGLIIGIVCGVIAIALAVGGVFAYKYFFSKKDDKKASTTENKTGAEEQKRNIDNKKLAELSYEEVTELEFYPNVAFEKKQLDKALEVIEERVKLLGENYELKADDKKITLIIEKALLGNSAYERMQSVELIKSNGAFGLTQFYSDYSTVNGDSWAKTINIVELNKNDILNDYVSSIEEEEYENIKQSTNDKFKVLEVTLEGANLSEFEDSLEYVYGDEISLWHNVTDKGDAATQMASLVFLDSKDKSKFYLFSAASGFEKNSKLMEKIITTKAMELTFDVGVMDEPTWEKGDKITGKNQKETLKGKSIVIECTPDEYTIKLNSEFDFEKHKRKIKTRLDILGVDYMFGIKGFDDKTLCVKLSPEEISPDLIRLIFNGGQHYVQSAFDRISELSYPMEVVNNGIPGIKIATPWDKSEILSNHQLDGALYLVVNDVTVAYAYFDAFDETDNSLTFTDFMCFDNSAIGQKELNYLNVIASISEEDYVSFKTKNYEIRYYEDDKEKKDVNINNIDWGYLGFSETDNSTMATISSMGHDVYKYIDERNMLVITMSVDVDENLVYNFFEEVKAVYAACNFDSGAYNKIKFVIENEKSGSFADCFNVEFTKDTYDGKMVYDDEVQGPKFSHYWSEAYDYLEADSFFVARRPY